MNSMTHSHHQHPASHADHGGQQPSDFRLAAQATIHCLIGCAIGELAGLAIGVTLGLHPMATMALATVLALISGYTGGLIPLVKVGHTWLGAFKTIWLGETISIIVMEIVMNFTDYHVGGVQAASVLEPIFWIGFLVALPAGYLVALPVNFWLLKRKIKSHCH